MIEMRVNKFLSSFNLFSSIQFASSIIPFKNVLARTPLLLDDEPRGSQASSNGSRSSRGAGISSVTHRSLSAGGSVPSSQPKPSQVPSSSGTKRSASQKSVSSKSSNNPKASAPPQQRASEAAVTIPVKGLPFSGLESKFP